MSSASFERVEVSCRFRPLSAAEQHDDVCITLEEPHHVICKAFQRSECPSQIGTPRSALGDDCFLPSSARSTKNHCCYTFSHVYGPDTGQKHVYDDVARPIVDSLVRGYNGTVLMYGPTGSGKTHTMFGSNFLRGKQTEATGMRSGRSVNSGSASLSYQSDNDDAGIVSRALWHLFQTIESEDEEVKFETHIFFVEVYMERVQDLLNPTRGTLHVREDLSGFYVENCEMPCVSNAEGALKLVRRGLRCRSVASTARNKTSSRSHSVLSISVRRLNSAKQDETIGKLFLVDLAGSEKVFKTQAGGLHLEEARIINRSLSTLGHVIISLSEKHGHVPYRDSKLTQILKESLGGNSRTSLIVCCSLSRMNMHETISSLQFGTRARKVSNRVSINRKTTVDELRNMLRLARLEIQKLRQERQTGTLPSPLEKRKTYFEDNMTSVSMGEGNGCRINGFDDTVEESLHSDVQEWSTLGDLQAEIKSMRDALVSAQCTNELLQKQCTQQKVLVQALQEENIVWENEYSAAMREVYAHRRYVHHLHLLLQKAQQQSEFMQLRLSSYVTQLHAISILAEENHLTSHHQTCRSSLIHSTLLPQMDVNDSVQLIANGQQWCEEGAPEPFFFTNSKPSLEPQGLVDVECTPSDDVAYVSEDIEFLLPFSDTINAEKEKHFVQNEQHHVMPTNQISIEDGELLKLRYTNRALVNRVESAEKKLAIRLERIENLKFGLRQACVEKQKLQQTLESERAVYYSQLQDVRKKALEWQKRYNDIFDKNTLFCMKYNAECSGYGTPESNSPESGSEFMAFKSN